MSLLVKLGIYEIQFARIVICDVCFLTFARIYFIYPFFLTWCIKEMGYKSN